MLGLACVLGTVAALLIALALVAVARHRAAAAADQAALAAAAAALDGPDRACTLAAQVAADHGAALTSCVLTGQVAEVSVALRPGGVLARFGPARARARAGPASPGPARPATRNLWDP